MSLPSEQNWLVNHHLLTDLSKRINQWFSKS